VIRVGDARMCLDLIDAASSKRLTGVSHLNVRSSRSHCVVKFVVRSAPPTGSVGALGQLCMVDLAGSEKEWLNPTADGKRVARTLNTSLASLNRLLRQLQTEGGLQESDRRQGSLNRVLYDHLKGGCGVSMLFCVTPEHESLPESLSTLQMAAGSQLVRNQRKQQFISVQGDMYALGRGGRARVASPLPQSSPTCSSPWATPAGRAELAEDSVDSTTAPADSTDEQKEEKAALAKEDAVSRSAHEKELADKVEELESRCFAFQRQLAMHEEYFAALQQDGALTATPKSSTTQLREWDEDVEKHAIFWRQEAERLQVELDSLRTGMPADSLRSIRAARQFWQMGPQLSQPSPSPTATSEGTADALPPLPPRLGCGPPMPKLDSSRVDSTEDGGSATPRRSSMSDSPPRAPDPTSPRSSQRAAPACVEIVLNTTASTESLAELPVSTREAGIQTRKSLLDGDEVSEGTNLGLVTHDLDEPVKLLASSPEITPVEPSPLELTSTSVFEATPNALTFDLGSDGSPSVTSGRLEAQLEAQLEASLFAQSPESPAELYDSTPLAKDVSEARIIARSLDKRPGARRESEGKSEAKTMGVRYPVRRRAF